jgi:hypothetical protein
MGAKALKAIRVNVAASGASDREEKFLPLTMHRVHDLQAAPAQAGLQAAKEV